MAVTWQCLPKKIHINQDTNYNTWSWKAALWSYWERWCLKIRTEAGSNWEAKLTVLGQFLFNGLDAKYSIWSHYNHWTITATDDEITISAQLFKLLIYFFATWQLDYLMWLKYGWVCGRLEIPSMIEQRGKTIQNVDRQDRKKDGLCLWLEPRPRFALR